MKLSSEFEIVRIIEQDEWMIKILRVVAELNLPDWWIGAGFVRSKIWDTFHNYSKRTPVPDIDVIYFDKNDYQSDESKKESTKMEIFYENKLKEIMPEIIWSVTNQSRMHLFHGDKPYKDSVEAMAQWVETATCVGVKLINNKIILVAPRGINDLINLVLRPINNSKDVKKLFKNRIVYKRWLEKWPKLKVVR